MKKFKNLFLMVMVLVAIVLMVLLTPACKTQDDPPPPPPPPPTYYTLQFRYTRPAGSIFRPDQLYKGVGVVVVGDYYFDFTLREKTDNYHFVWGAPIVVPDNELGSIYEMYGIDQARWNGIDDDTAVVGWEFWVKVVETGFEKQLLNVQNNTIPGCPTPGPSAKEVLWRLKKNGTISDN